MPPSQFVDDFDDDGLDDEYEGEGYGGDEGLSAEDEAAMANGTTEVRKALGNDASKVTLAQIQDALWHYYYDVEKSVAYLNKTFIAPPPPKPAPKPAPAKKAPEGTCPPISFSASHQSLERRAGAEQKCAFLADSEQSGEGYTRFPVFPQPKSSYLGYFSDMPWLNTPEARQTVFIPPWIPSGGLLGGGDGSGGMSKLQKLAAARKKKSDEKKGQEAATTQTQRKMSDLSISESSRKENLAPTNPLVKRQKISQDSNAPSLKKPASPVPEEQHSRPDSDESESAEESQEDITSESTPVKVAPSSFARTLFGSAPQAPSKSRREVFPMPYTSSTSFSASTFSEPSPDDIVLEAQSKGSNFAKAK